MNIIRAPEKFFIVQPQELSFGISFNDFREVALDEFEIGPYDENKAQWYHYKLFKYKTDEILPKELCVFPDSYILRFTNVWRDPEDPFVTSKKTLNLYSVEILMYKMLSRGETAIMMRPRPSDILKDNYENLTEQEKNINVRIAIFLFLKTNQRLKKAERKITKKMPTPEQKEDIERSGKEYRSAPVHIKDLTIQYVYDPHESRKYQRHCEAWSVRGHYRHYKSGKVVYIKPHKKGSGQIKDTQYIISK